MRISPELNVAGAWVEGICAQIQTPQFCIDLDLASSKKMKVALEMKISEYEELDQICNEHDEAMVYRNMDHPPVVMDTETEE